MSESSVKPGVELKHSENDRYCDHTCGNIDHKIEEHSSPFFYVGEKISGNKRCESYQCHNSYQGIPGIRDR